MDRRSFIKSLFAGVIAAANLDDVVESIVTRTESMPDEEFTEYVTYYIHYMNIWVANPRQLGYITGITDDN